MKDLAPLIRLHQRRVDERRKMLAELRVREDEFIQMLADLAASFLEEQKVAGASVMASFTYPAFARRTKTQRESLEASLHHLRQEIARAEEALAEAFRELKTFELAQEARDTAAREVRKRLETQRFDEIAAVRHDRARRDA